MCVSGKTQIKQQNRQVTYPGVLHIVGYMEQCESRVVSLKYLEVTGGVPLNGEITVQGSKNAVLPVLAACLLGNGTCEIENCPMIRDVDDTLAIMKSLGCSIERRKRTVWVTVTGQESGEICTAEATRIRSSVLFLGALLGKIKNVMLPLPGGCAIGDRPIDFHIKALRQMGAAVELTDRIHACCKQLIGTDIYLPLPSVGATENIILAAVLAEGETVIYNAAEEPEIYELCCFLNRRGACIRKEAYGVIRICGVKTLRPVRYRMHADRIVTGTYMLAAACTGGCIRIRNYPGGQMDALTDVLKKMGVQISGDMNTMVLRAEERLKAVSYLETAPYPGFPTDLQSILMASLCRADGISCICEKLFERRFQTAVGLRKMGACIQEKEHCVVIKGIRKMHAARVNASDLRGGAALVLGALQAEGCSVIEDTEYIDRGYEDICRDLRNLGALIRSVNR